MLGSARRRDHSGTETTGKETTGTESTGKETASTETVELRAKSQPMAAPNKPANSSPASGRSSQRLKDDGMATTRNRTGTGSGSAPALEATSTSARYGSGPIRSGVVSTVTTTSAAFALKSLGAEMQPLFACRQFAVKIAASPPATDAQQF